MYCIALHELSDVVCVWCVLIEVAHGSVYTYVASQSVAGVVPILHTLPHGVL